MSIPKNIFQTHKSFIYMQQRKPKIVNAMRTWKFKSNEFNYYFYNNKMCDDFIKQHFDEKIQRAYFKLPMGVMKADLWRYCILYKYGGIYADADTVCKIDPNIFINNSYLTVAPEPPTHNYFCQWTFAAPANSPILKTIIDLSVERILNTQIKGENIIHYLTGPECFTDGIQKYLKDNNRTEAFYHKKVYRPWGYYLNVEGNDYNGFKVKRILVYPGKKLSLQSHNKRSEHWVITHGNAKVQLGTDFLYLTKDQYVYIPVETKHRIENIGTEDLEFIETQIGTYLGEDDIIRYEDDFGRV